MNTLGSVILLNTIFFIILFLLRQQKFLQVCGILILTIISSIRWDIGNDFYNYYNGITIYSSYYRKIEFFDIFTIDGNEPFHRILIYLFKDFYTPAIFIIGIYSFATIWLFYKTLNERHGLFWGFFIIFYGGYLFLTWDQIRQGLAIAIFLFSIKYIDTKQIFKYYACCLLALCCHYSAIIIFPIYLLRSIYIPIWSIVIIILVMFIGFWLEVWTRFFMIIFSFNAQYIEYILKINELQEISSGIGIVAKVIIYSTSIILLHKNHNLLCNILLVGLCIYLFSCSNELLERLSNYGMACIIIGFPYIVEKFQLNFKLRYVIRTCLVSLIFLIGVYDQVKGAKGSIPYDCVFSKNYEMKLFRPRQY